MIQLFEFKVNKSRKKGFLLFDHLSRKYLAVCQLMSSINLCAQVSFITFVMAIFYLFSYECHWRLVRQSVFGQESRTGVDQMFRSFFG